MNKNKKGSVTLIKGNKITASPNNFQTATVIYILPSDKEVEKWFEENIDKDCSASSAIFKFRLWLKERMVDKDEKQELKSK